MAAVSSGFLWFRNVSSTKLMFMRNLASAKIAPVSYENAKPFKDMPGVPNIPVFGGLWQYFPLIGRYNKVRLHEASLDRFNRYGKVVKGGKIGPKLFAVHLYDPQDIELMFRYEGKHPIRLNIHPIKQYRERRKKWFRNGGLLAIQGEEWHHFRSKTQPYLLKPKSVANYLPAMQKVSEELIETIKYELTDVGELPDLLTLLGKWACESVSLIALDTKLGCLDPKLPKGSEQEKLVSGVLSTGEYLFKMMMTFPFYKYFGTPLWRRFEKNMDFFSVTALKYINETMERTKGKISTEEHELTVLELMLLRNDFDERDAVTMTADTILAGIDTTSHSAIFALYHLAKNPQAQERSYQEICKILPKENATIKALEIDNMKFLKACLKESMRLNPIFINNMRQMVEDVVIGGYQIPTGTVLISEHYIACKDEKHFPEPEKFKPERWLKENDEKFHPFLVGPFGFGPRMCIGRRIAVQELMLLLIHVLRKFKLEYHYEDIGMVTKFVNTPDRPVRIKFIPRD